MAADEDLLRLSVRTGRHLLAAGLKLATAESCTAGWIAKLLTDAAGTRIFDAISSWWVVTHGHCHPQIVQAIRDQAGRLDQVIFAGYTHAPAETFAAGLLRRLPDALTRVFFRNLPSRSSTIFAISSKNPPMPCS